MGEGLNLSGMCRQKGSLEGYVSSFIFQDHEAVLGTFHDWWANYNYHEMIINLALDAK